MVPKRFKTVVRQKPGPRPNTLASRPASDGEKPPTFSFLHADHEYDGGTDGWSWFSDREAGRLLRFLQQVGERTWDELSTWRENGRHAHHEQAIDTLCDEARQRIVDLGLDERFTGDTIFRFGMGPRQRLWGFTRDGVFYVLWWDRDHKVCPVDD